MTSPKYPHFSLAACLTLALCLSACGGGSSDTKPPVTEAKPPVALADTVSATSNQESTLNVLANDSHPDKLALELVSVGTPAHGTAALKNGALVYTPAAGYYGRDKVSYTVRAVGGSLSATAEASISVGMPLRLTGKVGVPAAMGSTVTVTVGTHAFTQTVAAGAAYDVPVLLESPEAMVTVTAQASGAENAHIKMISLAGSAAALYGASHGQGTLGERQLADLSVTLMSTAKYVAMRRVNDGRVPATQSEIDTAAARAPAQEILQMEGVLRLNGAPLPDEPAVALPAGVSDTLALALDTPAYTAFAAPLVQAPGSPLTLPMRNTLEDFRLQTVLNLATDRERILSLTPAPYNAGAADGSELIISPNGQARFRFQTQTYAGTWSKGSDSFVVTLTNPFLYYDPDWQGQLESTITSISFRQLTGGPDHGLVTMTMSGDGVQVGYPRMPYKQTRVLFANAWDSLAPLSVQDISGKTLAGLPDLFRIPGEASPLDFWGMATNQMRVAFAADGSASLLDHPGTSATWSIQDGKLRIAFGDGSVQELARRSADGGREHWIVRCNTESQFRVYDALMAQVQPGVAWTSAAQAAQNWRSLAYEGLGISTQFMLKLSADLSGSEINIRPDGTLFGFYANSWLLDNGQLVTNTFRLPSGSASPVCPAGVTCKMLRGRRWTLLRDDGDSIVVLERYTSFDSAMNQVIAFQRTAP